MYSRKAHSACRKSPPTASFFEIYAVSLSPPWGSRAGNGARKPCTARFPNPPYMSPDSDCIWRALALQTSRKGFLTVCTYYRLCLPEWLNHENLHGLINPALRLHHSHYLRSAEYAEGSQERPQQREFLYSCRHGLCRCTDYPWISPDFGDQHPPSLGAGTGLMCLNIRAVYADVLKIRIQT